MTRMVLALGMLFLTLVAWPVAAPADILLIEEVRQAGSMDVPPNGMGKADVSARFGDPVKKHQPVGDPPITRWEYSGWSVYFEHEVVLFTVLHKGEAAGKKSQ